MAGTVTLTSDSGNEYESHRTSLRKVVIDWTADAADGSIPDLSLDLGQPYQWYMFRGITDPGATAPTANYDIVVKDEFLSDFAEGKLMNRSATDTEMVRFAKVHPITSALTVSFSNNSVNSATGKLVLIFSK